MVVVQSPSTSTSDHNCVNLRVSTCHSTTNPIKISPRNRDPDVYAYADFGRGSTLLDDINWDDHELLVGDVDQHGR